MLLASAAAGGTIAAVRQLGAAGLEVGVLAGPRLGAAAWSRWNRRTFCVPDEGETEKFIARLLAIGRANPGQILLPTSDETAWMYAANVDALSKYFRLSLPSLDCMRRILDKRLFSEAVQKVGLFALPTWQPKDIDEVAEIAPSLPYPILIKPSTHVQRVRNDKGLVVRSEKELMARYREVVSRERFRSNAAAPILQRFVNVGTEGVCSVSGYIDRTGQLFVTRRSTKVLQRFQPVGIGICFESLPTNPALSEAVRKLCLELEYFGMFEVEFVRCDGQWAPIDFNGRIFNQVGMDIRRGMPLPLFACLEAAGDLVALERSIAHAQDCDEEAVFCDKFTLQAIMAARTLTGRISREEHAHWKRWLERHSKHAVDVVRETKDWMPAMIHVCSEVYLGLKAFRRFLRATPRLSATEGSEAVKGQS